MLGSFSTNFGDTHFRPSCSLAGQSDEDRKSAIIKCFCAFGAICMGGMNSNELPSIICNNETLMAEGQQRRLKFNVVEPQTRLRYAATV